MDGYMDEQKLTCVLLDIIPSAFRSAAQKRAKKGEQDRKGEMIE